MAVNKNHPDYPSYSQKHKDLWEAYLKREEEELAKYPDYRGLDHPADEVLRPLHRKLSADIKALQKEYRHLFIEDE